MKSHKINEFFGRYAAFLYFYAKGGMFTAYARNSEVWLKVKYSW